MATATDDLTTMTSPPQLPSPANPLALPSLDPSVESPYQPLNLPQEDSPAATLPPAQQDPNLGATNHAGAFAYLADQVLRGVVAGHAQAVAHQQDQFNKKLAAQQSLYNQQAQQYQELVKSGADPDSQEFKDARNRVVVTWQAMMDSIGSKIPQPKQAKGKGKSAAATAGGGNSGSTASTQAPGAPPDPNAPQATNAHVQGANLLQRMFDHSKPDEAIQAWYQGAKTLGPPVFHATAPMLTPGYRAKLQQQQQTQTNMASADSSQAQLKAQQAQLATEIVTLTRKPDRTAAEDALLDKKREDYKATSEALNPQHESNTTRQYVSPDGKTIDWYVPGRQPEGFTAYQKPSTAGIPKVGTFEAFVKAGYGDKPTPEQMLNARTQWAKATASGSVGVHTVMVMQKDGSQVPVQVETSTSKVFPGAGSVPSGAAATAPEASPVPASTSTGAAATPAHAHATATPSAATPSHARPGSNAGVISTGTPVGGHLNAPDAKEVTDATKGVNDVKEALTLAVQTAKDAAAGKNVSLQDNALVLGWNRAHTQRFNEAEINKINNLGGATMKLEGNVAKLVSGQLSDAQRNEFIRQMSDDLKVKSQHLGEVQQRVGLKPKTGGGDTTASTTDTPTPATHKFSISAWQKANPKGDAEAAKAAAKAQNFEVIP